MLVHLSNTLELRSYLNKANANTPLTQAVLENLERFLDRLINGPFRLRNEAETTERLAEIRIALSSLSLTDPENIEIGFQSLEELLRTDPARQMLIYSVAESGSVGQTLDSTELHRKRLQNLPKVQIRYQGEMRNIGLERRLRTVLNANGLKQVLRCSLYGVSFGKIFDKSIVSYYAHMFAHAIAGDVGVVEKMLPLSTKFRSNMPIGRYPPEPGEKTERWLVFTE